jgi:hypothetical protein
MLGRAGSTRYAIFRWYILVSALVEILRLYEFSDPWAYSQLWAVTEIPLVALSVLAMREAILRIRRHYPFDRGLTTALCNAIYVMSAAAWWSTGLLGTWHIHWSGVPAMSLFVQLTMLISPAITLALGTAACAIWALAQAVSRAWPKSLGWHVVLLSAAIMINGAAQWLVQITEANPRAYDIITTTQQALSLGVLFGWIWILRKRNERRAWNFESDFLARRTAAVAQSNAQYTWLSRELGLAWRGVRGSWQKGRLAGGR